MVAKILFRVEDRKAACPHSRVQDSASNGAIITPHNASVKPALRRFQFGYTGTAASLTWRRIGVASRQTPMLCVPRILGTIQRNCFHVQDQPEGGEAVS